MQSGPAPRRLFHRLPHSLDFSFCVGECPLLFCPAGSGKDHAGQSGRLGRENVLYHEKICPLDRMEHIMGGSQTVEMTPGVNPFETRAGINSV